MLISQKQVDSEVEKLLNEGKSTEDILTLIKEFTEGVSYWSVMRLRKRIKAISTKLGFDSAIQEVINSYELDTTKDIYNAADMEHIYLYIVKLMQLNTGKLDVITNTAHYTQRSKYSAEKNYKAALRMMEDETRKHISLIRMRRIDGLEADMKEAYDRYIAADTDQDAKNWFVIYLNIKTRIDGYYPNNLQMKDKVEDEKNQSIQIEYVSSEVIDD